MHSVCCVRLCVSLKYSRNSFSIYARTSMTLWIKYISMIKLRYLASMLCYSHIHRVTFLEKKVATPPFEATKSIWITFCASSGLELTWSLPMTDPQWNPTYLGWTFTQMSPKPQLSWSFPRMCLRTVASLNQQLHMFSQFSLTVLIMTRPTPIGVWHKGLALACEGMWQSDNAGCMVATVNRILRRHAVTGTLVPG